jgi:polyketide biosynthesis acyl carrier protein
VEDGADVEAPLAGNDLDISDVVKIIAEHARAVVPELQEHEFAPDDRLAELGANSIERAEIVVLTLSSLSLRIPLVATLQARNIGELAELLHARL